MAALLPSLQAAYLRAGPGKAGRLARARARFQNGHMHKRHVLGAAALLAAWALVPAARAVEPAPAEPTCAEVTAGVRNYGYGYQHYVTLTNHCDRPVQCEVWTNVDPTPHHELSAKPGET